MPEHPDAAAFSLDARAAFAPGLCTAFILSHSGQPGTPLARNTAFPGRPDMCGFIAHTASVSSGDLLWQSALPLTNGTWEVQPAIEATSYGGGYLQYFFSFDVSALDGNGGGTPVPEPRSLALLGLGLVTLARTRRSNAKAA